MPSTTTRPIKQFTSASLGQDVVDNLTRVASFLTQLGNLNYNKVTRARRFPGSLVSSTGSGQNFPSYFTAFSAGEISETYDDANKLPQTVFFPDVINILDGANEYLSGQTTIALDKLEEKKDELQEGVSLDFEARLAVIVESSTQVERGSLRSIKARLEQGRLVGQVHEREEVAFCRQHDESLKQELPLAAMGLGSIAQALVNWWEEFNKTLGIKTTLTNDGIEARGGGRDQLAVRVADEEQRVAGGEDGSSSEPKPPTPPPAPGQPLPTHPDPTNPAAFNSALASFSNSISQIVLNNLLAAYTTPDGGQPLISADSLSLNLKDALVKKLSLHLKNTLVSLEPTDLQTLLEGGEGASAIRLKIFRQAHSFALSSPSVRLLLQQAIVEGHKAISQQDGEQAGTNQTSDSLDPKPTSQQELEGKIASTSHESVASLDENFITANEKLWTLDQDEQKQQLQAILQQAQLTPSQFKTQFEDQLEQLGVNDQSKQQLIRANLEALLGGFILADPFLSDDFVNALGHQQLRLIFGNDVSSTLLQDNQEFAQNLLRQYWVLFRAELNRSNASLRKISEQAGQHGSIESMTEKQANNLLQRASSYRQVMLGGFDNQSSANRSRSITGMGDSHLDKNQSAVGNYIGLFGGDGVRDGKSLESGVQDFAAEFTKNLWTQLSLEERRRYLKDIGQESKLEELLAAKQTKRHQKTEPKLSNEELLGILSNIDHQFDIFRFAAIEQAHQQQLATMEVLQQVASLQSQAQARMQLLQVGAVLQGAQFYYPGQMVHYETGVAGAFEDHPFSPLDTQRLLAQTGAIDAAESKGTNKLLEKAAEMGVDAGLTYLTGGGWQAIPEPLRKMLTSMLVKQTLDRLKKLMPLLSAAAGIGALSLAALFKNLYSVLAAGGAATLGGLVGFALGGPLGALVGASVSGLAGGLLANKQISGAFAGKNSAWQPGSATSGRLSQAYDGLRQTTQATAGNARKLAGDLGNILTKQVSPKSVLSVNKKALFASTNLSTQFATASVGTLVGLSVTGIVVVSILMSAFLIEVPYLPKTTTTKEVSRFVKITKQASIVRVKDDDIHECVGSSRCLDPAFPIDVAYTITIEPINNYVVEIHKITDTARVRHNSDEYQTVPNIQAREIVYHDDQQDPILLDPNDPDKSSHTITYQARYDEDYNHARIRNVVKVILSYQRSGEVGNDQAMGATSVALGNAPPEYLCWAASGGITQEPFQVAGLTHSNLDAYDIAPRATTNNDLTLYSPADGTLCWGQLGSAYGTHVTLATQVDGEEYFLIMAHMVEGSAAVGVGKCTEVDRGEEIGIMGSTGYSTGTHLHFEKSRRSTGTQSLTELLTGDAITARIGEIVYSCAYN